MIKNFDKKLTQTKSVKTKSSYNPMVILTMNNHECILQKSKIHFPKDLKIDNIALIIANFFN